MRAMMVTLALVGCGTFGEPTENSMDQASRRPGNSTVFFQNQVQRDLAVAAWPGDDAVTVRMGLHTGAVTLSDGEYVGVELHRAARTIAVPTLLVRGANSDLVSADSVREFLDEVPHADFVDVGGAGHMVAGDDNDAFTDAVLRFLVRHLTSSET